MNPTLTTSHAPPDTTSEQSANSVGAYLPSLRWARWRYIIAAALTGLFFVADILLPRGATAAIGYCAVPVILGGSPRVLMATILCTGLTVVGFWWEAPGVAAWMSVFDRAMVAGVLWLTFVLVKRRAVFTEALVEHAEQLRNITAELRRSNADLERFASRAAHDLRGPLGSISLLAQLLARSDSVKDDAEATECVGSIASELQSMSNFIQSLLIYGRAGARDRAGGLRLPGRGQQRAALALGGN